MLCAEFTNIRSVAVNADYKHQEFRETVLKIIPDSDLVALETHPTTLQFMKDIMTPKLDGEARSFARSTDLMPSVAALVDGVKDQIKDMEVI